MSEKPPQSPADAPDGDGRPAPGEEPTQASGAGGAPGDEPTQVLGAAGAPGAPGEDPTQAFGPLSGSPYDAPGSSEPPTQPYGAAGGPAYGPAPTAGEAPYGARTTYSRDTYGSPEPEPEKKRWLVPVVVVGALLLVAAIVYLAMTVFGGDDGTGTEATPTAPSTTAAPTATATEEATTGATTDPTTDAPTTAAPTEEPTSQAPTSDDLERQLDESVVAGDATFTVTEEGFVPAPDIIGAGAVEAYTATYASGESQVAMLATSWPSVEEADAYAAELIAGLEGAEQLDTGTVYQNGTGTYWAFLLSDGSGMYVWTTDRGEVLRVTGPTDWVDGFYTGYSI
ncbi:hypothetical protein [Georgenia wangjunii]|uniref:hypothetical protein n=1 Tax=Georgenia wangjunii TaxID=3117730 RepID=UPI002F261DA2